jgi:hypothetical protein
MRSVCVQLLRSPSVRRCKCTSVPTGRGTCIWTSGRLPVFLSSAKEWGVRIAKDLYNSAGPGRDDSSCYLLSHR